MAQSSLPRQDVAKGEANGASPMHTERLRNLYSAMLKCRFSDGEIRKRMPGHRSCEGLEAVIAGAAVHLKPEDLVAPTADGDFARLVQGSALKDIIPQDRTVSAKVDVHEGRPSTFAELNVAAGMALALKCLKQSSITLCIAWTDHDHEFWKETLSFCADRQLPSVFVIAQHSGAHGQQIDLRSHALKFLPAITVDGDDAVAVYRVAEESTRRARQGLGPSLIECRVDTGRDPLQFMETYLRQRNLWSDIWRQELERSLRRPGQAHGKTRQRK